MGYSVRYPVNDKAGGDTVKQAFGKYNAEVTAIYGILNELKGNDLTPSEIDSLKYGSVAGSRITGSIDGSHITGTVAGNIDGQHVTGNISGNQISGTIITAQIPSGNVTGLEAFVNELIDGHGGDKSGYGITSSNLGTNGYVKFGNGFMVQWGSHLQNTSLSEYDIDFPTAFTSACYSVLISSNEPDVTLGGSPTVPTTTGFRVKDPSGGARIYFIAVGV